MDASSAHRGDQNAWRVVRTGSGQHTGQTGKRRRLAAYTNLIARAEGHHSDQPRGPARLSWHPRGLVIDETAQQFQRLLERAVAMEVSWSTPSWVEWFKDSA